MSEVARPGPLISPGATLVPDLALARHQHHGQTRAMLGAGQAAHHTYLCLSSTNTDTETHGHTGYQDVTLQTHSDTRIMAHSCHWSPSSLSSPTASIVLRGRARVLRPHMPHVTLSHSILTPVSVSHPNWDPRPRPLCRQARAPPSVRDHIRAHSLSLHPRNLVKSDN